MLYSDEDWKPTRILEVGTAERTSTGVTRVTTDAGEAYCKPIGNRQGEHALACEWACIGLARWIGLSTFKAAIIPIDKTTTFPLPDHKGQHYAAIAGPAFLTQLTPGRQWNSTKEDLERLENPEDVSRLVCFDMWVRNRDRHHHSRRPNYGNVYFVHTDRPDVSRLIAMDHTHCFDNGLLGTKLRHIDVVKDDTIYGLFPEFVSLMREPIVRECELRLVAVVPELIRPFVDEVPPEWQVDRATREAWIEMLVGRARYLSGQLRELLESAGKVNRRD